jgi:hypothetical protein
LSDNQAESHRPMNPPDLSDDSWMLNTDRAHAHPYQKGLAITDKPSKWCTYCGNQYNPNEAKCPECGSPTATLLGANKRFSLTPRNVTAQSRREIDFCWNVDEDAISGDLKRHKFVEEVIGVVNLTSGEYHDLTRCKTCHTGYTKKNGRAATEDEIAKAKAGKIPAPPQRLAGYGTNP